jgi:alpha-glucoside transport system permease protein
MIIRVLLIAVAAVIGVPLVLTLYILLGDRGISRAGPRWREKLRPWVWLLPGLFLLVVFLIYPVVNTIVLSFKNADSSAFVGLKNYAYIFTDPSMLIVLRNNGLWLVFFTLVTVTLGLLIAVLTNRVKYEAAAKAFIFLPMAISFVAAGVIWRFMYAFQPKGAAQIGTVNAVLTSIVPSFQPVAWLFNPATNNWALIVAGIWVWTGFAMVILSAGLKGVPSQLVEAARWSFR